MSDHTRHAVSIAIWSAIGGAMIGLMFTNPDAMGWIWIVGMLLGAAGNTILSTAAIMRMEERQLFVLEQSNHLKTFVSLQSAHDYFVRVEDYERAAKCVKLMKEVDSVKVTRGQNETTFQGL